MCDLRWHDGKPCTCRRALLAFIRLLDIDAVEAFKCPICSSLPPQEQVIIMDGKAMGMQRAGAATYEGPYYGRRQKEPLW